MQKLLRHYPNHYFDGDSTTISSPYEPLIQNWDLLWEESGKDGHNEKDKEARDDLKELLVTILKGSGDAKLDSYMQSRESLKKQRIITFEALWTVFPPGTIIYGSLFLKYDQVFIVEKNENPWPWVKMDSGSGELDSWTLYCCVYDFNGKEFTRQSVELKFEDFQGTKPISTLAYHPLEEEENRAEIESNLVKRGELFRRYCTAVEGARMFDYSGEAITSKGGLHGSRSDPRVSVFPVVSVSCSFIDT